MTTFSSLESIPIFKYIITNGAGVFYCVSRAAPDMFFHHFDLLRFKTFANFTVSLLKFEHLLVRHLVRINDIWILLLFRFFQCCHQKAFLFSLSSTILHTFLHCSHKHLLLLIHHKMMCFTHGPLNFINFLSPLMLFDIVFDFFCLILSISCFCS